MANRCLFSKDLCKNRQTIENQQEGFGVIPIRRQDNIFSLKTVT